MEILIKDWPAGADLSAAAIIAVFPRRRRKPLAIMIISDRVIALFI